MMLMILALWGCEQETLPAAFDGPFGHCEYTAVALGADEATAAGYTPAEAKASAESPRTERLTYTDGRAATDATATFTADGDGVYETGAWVWDEAPEEGEEGHTEDCNARLTFTGTLSFVSDDGALAETLDGAVVYDHSHLMHGGWSAKVELGSLSGSYAPSEVDPADWDEVWLTFSGDFADRSVGTVHLEAYRVDEDSDEGWIGDVALWEPS